VDPSGVGLQVLGTSEHGNNISATKCGTAMKYLSYKPLPSAKDSDKQHFNFVQASIAYLYYFTLWSHYTLLGLRFETRSSPK